MSNFLNLIAWSEGTSLDPLTHNDGYDVIVGGINGRSIISNYNRHPFADGQPAVCVRKGPPPLYSTASGRYQIILPTWEYLSSKYGLKNFTAANQDAAAIHLIEERHCDKLIYAGNVAEAIQTVSNIWASFPGNLYNQGGFDLNVLIAKYHSFPA